MGDRLINHEKEVIKGQKLHVEQLGVQHEEGYGYMVYGSIGFRANSQDAAIKFYNKVIELAIELSKEVKALPETSKFEVME